MSLRLASYLPRSCLYPQGSSPDWLWIPSPRPEPLRVGLGGHADWNRRMAICGCAGVSVEVRESWQWSSLGWQTGDVDGVGKGDITSFTPECYMIARKEEGRIHRQP